MQISVAVLQWRAVPVLDGIVDIRQRTRERVGANLRRIREARGLSREELSTKTRIRRDQIAHWECGHYKPNDEHLDILGEVLEVSEQEFYVEENEA